MSKTRVMKSGFFLEYIHAEYITKMKLKTKEKDGVVPYSNLEFWELNPLKIHLSLNYDDFKAHKETITNLLTYFIEQDVINQFKHANDAYIEQTLKLFAQTKALLTQFLKELQMNPEKINEFPKFNELCNKIIPFEIKEKSVKEDIADILVIIEKKEKKISRFLGEDQFTIYIPQHFDKEKIFVLCKGSDRLINQNRMRPGTISDVAVPVTPTMNIRQEYLLGDDERIDAVSFDANNEKRIQVKKQIEANEFYIELKALLNPKLMNNTNLLLSGSRAFARDGVWNDPEAELDSKSPELKKHKMNPPSPTMSLKR